MSEKERFVSPEAKLLTTRSYDEYLDYFVLPEEALKGVQILDMGSGFADFVNDVNKRQGLFGTHAIGVDPVYTFLNGDYDAFIADTRKAHLYQDFDQGRMKYTEEIGHDEWAKRQKQFYQEFVDQAKAKGSFVAGTNQGLPFRDESFDLILASNSITLFNDKDIAKVGLYEALRVLRPAGEGRLLPAHTGFDDEKQMITLEYFGPDWDGASQKESILTGRRPDRAMLAVYQELEAAGLTFYAPTVYAIHPDGRKRTWTSQVFIFRKDDQLPHVDLNLDQYAEGDLIVSNPQLHRLDFTRVKDDYWISSEVFSLA